MKIIKTLNHDILKNVPIWVILISIFGLYNVTSLINTPQDGVFAGAITLFVLILTNIIFLPLKKFPIFNKSYSAKKRFFIISLRIILYEIISAFFVTIFELLLQAYAYHIFLMFGLLVPICSSGCLLLSQYGSYPIHNPFRKTIRNSVEVGIIYFIILVSIGTLSKMVNLNIQIIDTIPFIFACAIIFYTIYVKGKLTFTSSRLGEKPTKPLM